MISFRLVLAQIQDPDLRVEVVVLLVRHAAEVVVPDHLRERPEPAVVHVRGGPADLPELTPEEMRDAATRYLRARYAQSADPWVSGQVWREDPEPDNPDEVWPVSGFEDRPDA